MIVKDSLAELKLALNTPALCTHACKYILFDRVPSSMACVYLHYLTINWYANVSTHV